MTQGWSDGMSFLPLDFILCSSSKAGKRLQGGNKKVDQRCCGCKRRLEAMAKSTEHSETMVKGMLARGIRVDYFLMDSWFAFPAPPARLGKHLPVICMGKNMPKVFYQLQGQWFTWAGSSPN